MSGPPQECAGRDAATTRLLEAIEREAGLSQAGLEARVSRLWPPEQRQGVAARLAGLSWRDPEWQALVEPLLVHETYLFRDWAQLRHLAQTGLRPRLAERLTGADKRLTIWTAGCSSGEEAYSLAAVALSVLQQDSPERSVAVVGSDLSHEMVKRAGRAMFTVSGLSPFRAMRPEFDPMFPDAGGQCRTVTPDLRRLAGARRRQRRGPQRAELPVRLGASGRDRSADGCRGAGRHPVARPDRSGASGCAVRTRLGTARRHLPPPPLIGPCRRLLRRHGTVVRLCSACRNNLATASFSQ